ncbi:SDR family oxidoreductase [Pelagicoccus enzymogenes]|uniref:SDR family oxidoreductase n=1 Tax=Pelagicoccus enzymogenes TaxID=2773457 RepID=UPI00280D5B97|nr:SDR family oxidoreductase [Pelagicoccus enzymogenes]MDQ8199753.1 SDR family oxidoreductase [Pelagicoccus enzymogenes]
MDKHTERFSLGGKRALVTGGAQGLGFAMARGLAEAGAEVVLNDVDPARLAKAVAALEADGLAARSVVFDVTDGDGARRGVDRIEAEAGPIDILLNNAGIHRYAALEAMSLADWQRVIDVNLTGAFMVAQAVARGMLERGAGRIVNVCSLMSEGTRPNTANYTAAKGGLKSLTQSMAVEWGPRGVRANGIGPGYILSDLTRHLAEQAEFDAWVKRRTPVGRWGTPEDLVGAAVFLASPASEFVNGHVLYVDGGWLAGL